MDEVSLPIAIEVLIDLYNHEKAKSNPTVPGAVLDQLRAVHRIWFS